MSYRDTGETRDRGAARGRSRSRDRDPWGKITNYDFANRKWMVDVSSDDKKDTCSTLLNHIRSDGYDPKAYANSLYASRDTDDKQRAVLLFRCIARELAGELAEECTNEDLTSAFKALDLSKNDADMQSRFNAFFGPGPGHAGGAIHQQSGGDPISLALLLYAYRQGIYDTITAGRANAVAIYNWCSATLDSVSPCIKSILNLDKNMDKLKKKVNDTILNMCTMGSEISTACAGVARETIDDITDWTNSHIEMAIALAALCVRYSGTLLDIGITGAQLAMTCVKLTSDATRFVAHETVHGHALIILFVYLLYQTYPDEIANMTAELKEYVNASIYAVQVEYAKLNASVDKSRNDLFNTDLTKMVDALAVNLGKVVAVPTPAQAAVNKLVADVVNVGNKARSKAEGAYADAAAAQELTSALTGALVATTAAQRDSVEAQELLVAQQRMQTPFVIRASAVVGKKDKGKKDKGTNGGLPRRGGATRTRKVRRHPSRNGHTKRPRKSVLSIFTKKGRRSQKK